MKIQPIGERVLITPKENESRTKGGLYIPESAKEERKEGTVVAVGQYRDGKPLPIQANDKILYGGYSSDEFEFDGKKFIMIDFKDVLAKLE